MRIYHVTLSIGLSFLLDHKIIVSPLVAKHVLLLFQRNWRLIVDGTIILMTTSFLLVDGVGVGFWI